MLWHLWLLVLLNKLTYLSQSQHHSGLYLCSYHKKCSFICVLAHCPKKAFRNPGFLLILWLKFNWINQKTVRLTHINTFGSSATTMHVCAQLGSDWSTVVITNQKYIIQSDHTLSPSERLFRNPWLTSRIQCPCFKLFMVQRSSFLTPWLWVSIEHRLQRLLQ